jgi:hypothetical protein
MAWCLIKHIGTIYLLPNKMAEAVTLLTYVWGVPSSNLGRDTDHTEVFRDIPQFCQATAVIGHDLPSTPISSYSFHHLRYVLWDTDSVVVKQ